MLEARLTPGKRLLVVAGIILVVAIGLFAMRMLRSAPQILETADTRPFVETSLYKASEDDVLVEGFGSVRSELETRLASEIHGRVLTLHGDLRRGAIVSAGAELIRIDPRPFQARLAKLEAEKRSREAEYRQLASQRERLRDLARSQFVSADQLEELDARTRIAEAALAGTRASLDLARLDLERTVIDAPFDAAVRQLAVGPGDVVQAGQVLAHLTSLERFEVRVALSARETQILESLAPGAQAWVESRTGQRYPAEFSRLSALEDENSRTIEAVLHLDAAGTDRAEAPRVGEFVRATLPVSVAGIHYRVPRAALREADAVWRIDADGRAQRTPVEVILLSGDRAYLRADALGDTGLVMTTHPPILADGMPVRTRQVDDTEP